MAEEEGDSVRVLNYAPGPIDTDMQLAARTETGDPELRTMFAGKTYFWSIHIFWKFKHFKRANSKSLCHFPRLPLVFFWA